MKRFVPASEESPKRIDKSFGKTLGTRLLECHDSLVSDAENLVGSTNSALQEHGVAFDTHSRFASISSGELHEDLHKWLGNRYAPMVRERAETEREGTVQSIRRIVGGTHAKYVDVCNRAHAFETAVSYLLGLSRRSALKPNLDDAAGRLLSDYLSPANLQIEDLTEQLAKGAIRHLTRQVGRRAKTVQGVKLDLAVVPKQSIVHSRYLNALLAMHHFNMTEIGRLVGYQSERRFEVPQTIARLKQLPPLSRWRRLSKALDNL